MFRRLAVGVILTLLVGTALAVATTGPVIGSDAATGAQPPQTTPERFNNTVFEIRVYENGSALWTVQHSTPLTSQEEVDQFRSYAGTFRTEETEVYRNFRIRADRLTAFGTNATGREMTATGFRRDATVDELGQTRGVIELSFWWSNFTRSQGDQLVVDDVFEGGMFIDSGQRLVFATGPDLDFARMPEPEPDSMGAPENITASETATWFGERQFADRRPYLAFTSEIESIGEPGGSPTTTATKTTTPTDTPVPPGTEQDGGLGMLPAAIVLVLLLGIGGGFAWYSGALSTIGGRSDGAASTDGSSTHSARSATTGPEGPEQPEPIVGDEELLSDEDRVLKLLEDNGGRMKQVKIVEDTDWSKSKVSMLLSEMEDEGTISKLRVGRENIISLAGEEPDAVGSPFDDE